jgi:predicted anti-sigma-YlaC factor YlaD
MWNSGRILGLTLLAMGIAGCSMKKMAVNSMSDALAEGGTTYAQDDDPEFIKQATPFSLKLIESLLAENPKHRGLLLAACKGFTQYSYAFIQEDADEMETTDLQASLALKHRAIRMYLRARGYGLRGLDLDYPDFEKSLRANPRSTVQKLTAKDVPLLYWTAAAWGSAISNSKDNPEMIADQLLVEAMIDRALELDEKFGSGAVYSFLISYEAARQGAKGESSARSKKYFDLAVKISKGKLAGPYVAYAETVCVKKQDKKEFETLLNQALAIDPDADIDNRLVNLVMQRRARWLLARTDELFVE